MNKQQRQQFLSLILKRMKKGAGSSFAYLMQKRDVTRMKIPFDFDYLVCGCRAANLFMPPRHTDDWDLLVNDLGAAEAEMESKGAKFIGTLTIGGSAWEFDDVYYDLIDASQYKWFNLAKTKAKFDTFGNPCLDIPFIVVMKFSASRMQDLTDIARMLGQCDEFKVKRIKKIFLTYFPEDEVDFNQILEMGKAEL